MRAGGQRGVDAEVVDQDGRGEVAFHRFGAEEADQREVNRDGDDADAGVCREEAGPSESGGGEPRRYPNHRNGKAEPERGLQQPGRQHRGQPFRRAHEPRGGEVLIRADHGGSQPCGGDRERRPGERRSGVFRRLDRGRRGRFGSWARARHQRTLDARGRASAIARLQGHTRIVAVELPQPSMRVAETDALAPGQT